MVGVVSHQSGEIDRHRQSAAAVFQQIFVALIGFLGGREAGKLTHGVQLAAISGGVNAASIRWLPRIAQVLFVVPVLRQICLGVKSANGNSGNCGEAGISVLIEIGAGRCANRLLWSFFQGRRQRLFRPLFFGGRRMPSFKDICNRAVCDLRFLLRHAVSDLCLPWMIPR